MVGMHEKYKYRISQVLHPFGEQGEYVHHVQIKPSFAGISHSRNSMY
jgi:hypothetical protein